MIEIIKSPDSDCRPVDGKVDYNKLWLATGRHIDNVSDAMEFFGNQVIQAGDMHDYTKILNFDDYHKALESGNKRSTDWYKLHITEERHHIVESDYRDVTLIDLLEYISDCVMAGSVRTNDPQKINLKISNEILQNAFANTLEMLKKEVVVKEVK